LFAAFKLGAVPVNANYRYTKDELTALLADADAAALVFSGGLAANVVHAASALPSLRLLVRAGPAPDLALPEAGPARDAPELAGLYAATAPRPPEPRPSADDLFMYTGGTTGKPKGVIWHQSQLFGSMSAGLFGRLGVTAPPPTVDELVAIVASARASGRSPVALSAVPLMHATGLFNTMGTLTAAGGSC